jgi:hypothetical protein
VATLSVIMLAIAILMSWIYRTVQNQAPRYAVVTGKAYRPRVTTLGRWKWPAVGFVVAFFFISQVLPVLMLAWASVLPYLQTPSMDALGQLTLRQYYAILPDLLLRAMKNTGILMVLVPTVALALSFAISWVVLRTKTPGRALFDFFAFLPVASGDRQGQFRPRQDRPREISDGQRHSRPMAEYRYAAAMPPVAASSATSWLISRSAWTPPQSALMLTVGAAGSSAMTRCCASMMARSSSNALVVSR